MSLSAGDIFSFALIIVTVVFAFVKKVRDEKNKLEESQNKVGNWSEGLSSLSWMTKSNDYNPQPVQPVFVEEPMSRPQPVMQSKPFGSDEGESVTKVSRTEVKSVQEKNDKDFAINLHDKDTLRQAIILSDILPPKF